MNEIADLTACSPSSIKKYLILAGKEVKEQNLVRELKTDDERLIGLYCGLWTGDGSQYYDHGYTIKFCLNREQPELIGFVQELLLKLFGKTSKKKIRTGKTSFCNGSFSFHI